jgi:uncharacterized protein YegP (UPF0339 family)
MPAKPKFEIYKNNRKEYRWRLRAANNKIIASGEGYDDKGGVEHAIKLIKNSWNATTKDKTKSQ